MKREVQEGKRIEIRQMEEDTGVRKEGGKMRMEEENARNREV